MRAIAWPAHQAVAPGARKSKRNISQSALSRQVAKATDRRRVAHRGVRSSQATPAAVDNPAPQPPYQSLEREGSPVSPLAIGLLIFVLTTALLATGLPIAFGLGAVALLFMVVFDGWNSVHFVPETIFAGLSDFTLVSLPMFIIMGAAVASSRAGSDLYEALARWLHRVPGSLVISNIGACALFSALTGSSPATCAAIGKMGIPEMRKRGYDADLATGAIAAGGTLGILIPPSITMILYGIASETSIGRLFIAGI
ncbi:MAG: TRAP transporter large permease subunit, partial [Rhodoferax sp.]|nr:TRAP transporter large permease subunit [Rhodoferax sp.]